MTEHPILFGGEMVRAILDGRKTQTRRVVKLPPWIIHDDAGSGDAMKLLAAQRPPIGLSSRLGPADGQKHHWRGPFGQPGDRLWVRETWRPVMGMSRSRVEYCCSPSKNMVGTNFDQMAELMIQKGGVFEGLVPTGCKLSMRWRPSIHMPRWASRLTLEVLSIRVQRLREISEEDAVAEGVVWPMASYAFATLWDRLAKPGTKWDDNPWVWAVEFRRVP